MSKETITITGEYITLAQLLKKVNLVSSGGEAKGLLESGAVHVNDKVETRRGRKVRPGDEVSVGFSTWMVESE